MTAKMDPGDVRMSFLQSAQAVLSHDRLRFPELVAAAAAPEIAADPLVNLVMMRAAQNVGRPQVAAHYAARVRSAAPSDVEASTAVAVDLVARSAYEDAVDVIDDADAWHCDDDERPLDRTLKALESAGEGPEAAALAVIGDYMHREDDPTVPVSAAQRASRDRWRKARRQRTRRVPVDRLALAVVICVVGAAGFFVTRTLYPAVLCSLVAGGWLRRRPVPGLDLAGSHLVRALRSPLARLTSRQYHAIDVFFLLVTLCAGLSLASLLPPHPTWLTPVGVVVGIAAALMATRGRRRWVRHERTRLQRPFLDPAVCRCLDIDRLHRQTAQPYVDAHLFPVLAVAGLPGWGLVQCLETYRYFLTCPAAGLTIALSTQQS